MTTSTSSHRFARLLGPAIFTISSAEALNAHIWATSNAPTVFLNGSLIFVSGLAIVQNHNHWRRDWTVLVTVAGWMNVILGLTRMLVPERIMQSVRRAEVKEVRVGAAVFAALGGVLTVCGWFGT
jgi:hypothetical protein